MNGLDFNGVNESQNSRRGQVYLVLFCLGRVVHRYLNFWKIFFFWVCVCWGLKGRGSLPAPGSATVWAQNLYFIHLHYKH